MDQAKVAPTAIELVRLKNASEAYKVHKSIYIDPVSDEQLPGFQAWPEFRDEFLADWKSNRRLVTEKEADVIFDTIANESLSELETIGATDVAALADVLGTAQDETIGVIVENPTTGEPIAVATVVVKRRGRPPGTAKLKLVASTEAPVAAAKRGRPPGAKKTAVVKSKKVAAKKKGGNTSAKAQAIVERYVARKWSRKDIIVKLQAQIDGLGAAYASTLYQKFA